MLLTLDQECKRLGVFVPGPTRLHKVEQSMELVERVLKERERAILHLEKERKYKFDEDNDLEKPEKMHLNIVENEEKESELKSL